jgi:hypothetical protein
MMMMMKMKSNGSISGNIPVYDEEKKRIANNKDGLAQLVLFFAGNIKTVIDEWHTSTNILISQREKLYYYKTCDRFEW